MILEAMATLVTEKDLGAPGETLFLMTMPAETRRGVILKTPLSGVAYDAELPGFHKTSVQAIVRDGDYMRGRQTAQDIMDALTLEEGRQFDLERRRIDVLFMHPTTLPIEYPRQEGGGFEWSVNLRCAYRVLAK